MVPRLPSRFHVSRGTSDPARSFLISITGLSPSMAGFPKTVLLSFQSLIAVHNPRMHALWFRLFPFRSPLLWKSSFSFFSSGYLDVSVPRVPPHAPMYSVHADGGLLRRVSPFRYLRINGYLLLPEAFRSLLRLSSALSAKASTLRSLLLDHHKECSVNPYGSRFVFKSFLSFLSPSQFPVMSSDVFFPISLAYDVYQLS